MVVRVGPLKKQQEEKLHSAEMKMLRWAGGVTRLDHIRNMHVRGSFRVAPVYEKVMEVRLRWYGPVNRRSPNHMTRNVLDMETQPRGRGRPRLTWLGLVHKNMKQLDLTNQTTQDRSNWRLRSRRADPK
ncbi:uncharacterized protein LOC120356070 [Nilaparvata lugens]|uniref:uncharacterized protein LOC120356070 n=1 Tax=Nilaparvata lugens TaxID=108931 RepID=UPI00193DEB1C|nr:uncharacterized protein LOC120356070 [Nilaparvata lugens]